MVLGADDIDSHKAQLALAMILQRMGVGAEMFAKWMVHYMDQF